jgi:carnosine N-methyltransferase
MGGYAGFSTKTIKSWCSPSNIPLEGVPAVLMATVLYLQVNFYSCFLVWKFLAYRSADTWNSSQYAKVAHYNTTHIRRQSFYALPKAHWELLAAPPFSYLDTLSAIDDAIDENAELATAIVKSGLKSFGFPPDNGLVTEYPQWRGTATASDFDKARSTLRQFYRDWSSEGVRERAECLDPIIHDLQAARKSLGVAKMSVLVPGAGLGRLVFELCGDGFDVEGNEISYHQLLASSYILNFCPSQEVHKLYPWVHSFSNHINREHQLKSVRIPDVHPATVLNKGRQIDNSNTNPDGYSQRQPGEMSMSAADFVCLYGKEQYKDTFDAIATVFFIDTAPNPIRYIETVRNCLRRGGIWTNLGPLLWHFENNPPGKHGYKRESPPAEDSEAESPGTYH